MSTRIPVGQIVNVHGIKGAVKIKPYLNDLRVLTRLNPLSDKSGERLFEISSAKVNKEVIIAGIKGVSDRNTAETLRGIELYANRDKLPQALDNEYYYCDLIGLTVFNQDTEFGVVKNVTNYGAGDIIEIQTSDGRTLDFAFTADVFPQVDLQAHRIDIVLPTDVNGDVDED